MPRVCPRAPGEAAAGKAPATGDRGLTPIPLIEVTGSHRDAGLAPGRATADVVRPSAAGPFDTALAERFRAVTAGHLPEVVEELDAVPEAVEMGPLAAFAAAVAVLH